MPLMPFQEDGVTWITQNRRVILGDDRGLGKSVQALTAIERAGAYPCVVIVPAGHVRTAWSREINRWLPHRSVKVALGRPTMLTTDFTVIGYTEADKWAPVLPTGFPGLILDESHRAKNVTARQTRAVLALSKKASPDAMMIALTGTLAPNGRNGEVVSVLRLLRRLPDFGGVAGVMAMDKQELHRRLSATCYLRRLKADVVDLPPRWWVPLYVTGEGPAWMEYQTATRGLVARLAAQINDAGQNWSTVVRDHAHEYRNDMTHLFGLLAKIKARPALEWIDEFTSDGRKVIVFGERRFLVSQIADACGGLRIQGGQNDVERARHVDAFQNDPDRLVISCNMAAAGEGLTLTAASDVLFVEQAWTPGAMDQCLDRAHRIGQKGTVTGWVMQVAGSLDEDRAQLLAEKRTGMDAIQDGLVGEVVGGLSLAGDLLVRLAARNLHLSAEQAGPTNPG